MKITLIVLSSIALAASFSSCSSAQKKDAEAATAKTAETAKTTEKKAEKAATPGVVNSVTCEKDKESRSLVVVNKGEGCEFQYTKGGQMKVAASSSKGTKHCEDSVAKVSKNLEKAGYKCM